MLLGINNKGLPELTFADKDEASYILDVAMQLGLGEYYGQNVESIEKLKQEILTKLSFPRYGLYILIYYKYGVNSATGFIDLLKNFGLSIKPKRSYRYLSMDDNFISDLYSSLSASKKYLYSQALISMIINIFDTTAPDKITISIPTVNTGNIPDFEAEFENSPLLVLNDGVYKMKLEKTKLTSLNKMKKFATDQFSQVFKMQLAAIENAHKDKIRELTKKIDELNRSRFIDLIKTLNSLVNKGWTVMDRGIFYSKIVYANKMITNSKDGPAIAIAIPPKYRFFYISGIYIPYHSNVTTAYAVSAFHPNSTFNDLSDTSIISYDFPRGELNGLCIGDLSNNDTFTVASKIVEQFETINLTSAYSNVSTELARIIAQKLINTNKDEDHSGKTPENILWSSRSNPDEE